MRGLDGARENVAVSHDGRRDYGGAGYSGSGRELARWRERKEAKCPSLAMVKLRSSLVVGCFDLVRGGSGLHGADWDRLGR